MSAWQVIQWAVAALVVVVCGLGVLCAVWLAIELIADAIRDALRRRAAKRAEARS